MCLQLLDYRRTSRSVNSQWLQTFPISVLTFWTNCYRLSIISRLPKLRFLDAKQVDKKEMLLSLQLSRNSLQTQQTLSELPEARMEKLGLLKKFFGLTSKQTAPSTSAAAYNPLPNEPLDSSQASQKSVYGKVKNHYEGSQSQGNRFILNQDL